MIYEAPEEHEFVYEGFGLSDSHDPDEIIYSYVYLYQDGKELTFTHSPSMGEFVKVNYLDGDEMLFEIYKEEITNIKFSGYNGERTIEVYVNNREEFKVFYSPKARLSV